MRNLNEDFGERMMRLPESRLDFLYFDYAYKNIRPPTEIGDEAEEKYEPVMTAGDFSILPDAILDLRLNPSKPVTLLRKTLFKRKPRMLDLMKEMDFDNSWMTNNPLPDIITETTKYLKRWEQQHIPIPVPDEAVEIFNIEHNLPDYPTWNFSITGKSPPPLLFLKLCL